MKVLKTHLTFVLCYPAVYEIVGCLIMPLLWVPMCLHQRLWTAMYALALGSGLGGLSYLFTFETFCLCQRLWIAMCSLPLPVGSGLGGLGFRFTFERFACVKSIYSTECFKNLKTIPCPLFILVQNTLFSDPITVHTFISPSSFLPTIIFHCTYMCIRLCFLPFCVHAMVHSSLCVL